MKYADRLAELRQLHEAPLRLTPIDSSIWRQLQTSNATRQRTHANSNNNSNYHSGAVNDSPAMKTLIATVEKWFNTVDEIVLQVPNYEL